ncbi:hypothetical protein CYMTET_48364 [Cymbomonas tetramitiformis]|uniref:SWIM-type domain-containing protein n=1 Tax=Cymbomonas tetramitiformis TaxID=36881 RepID=A0AAE0BTN0_9CHLO|nr:hypothetical protein CYMTET_48364 [Cymbomonas tetramitiformis]|eukprot:gene34348-biopygen26452
MAACEGLHGETVNSTVEAMTAVNDLVRKELKAGVHMRGALLQCVSKKSGKRFHENKWKAQAATGQLPRAVMGKLEDVREKAALIASGVTTFPAGNNKNIARVESTTQPGVAYTSQLVTVATCGCGAPAQIGLPCHHNIAHARFAGLD